MPDQQTSKAEIQRWQRRKSGHSPPIMGSGFIQAADGREVLASRLWNWPGREPCLATSTICLTTPTDGLAAQNWNSPRTRTPSGLFPPPFLEGRRERYGRPTGSSVASQSTIPDLSGDPCARLIALRPPVGHPVPRRAIRLIRQPRNSIQRPRRRTIHPVRLVIAVRSRFAPVIPDRRPAPLRGADLTIISPIQTQRRHTALVRAPMSSFHYRPPTPAVMVHLHQKRTRPGRAR
jgi:hypothetical protein